MLPVGKVETFLTKSVFSESILIAIVCKTNNFDGFIVLIGNVITSESSPYK